MSTDCLFLTNSFPTQNRCQRLRSRHSRYIFSTLSWWRSQMFLIMCPFLSTTFTLLALLSNFADATNRKRVKQRSPEWNLSPQAHTYHQNFCVFLRAALWSTCNSRSFLRSNSFCVRNRKMRMRIMCSECQLHVWSCLLQESCRFLRQTLKLDIRDTWTQLAYSLVNLEVLNLWIWT